MQDEEASKETDRPNVVAADAIEWLGSLKPGSVDLVFGSPPYENARLYLEDGNDLGIARDTWSWVSWMFEVYKASLAACKGLVAFVVEGKTRHFKYSAAPLHLASELDRSGVCLRKPPIFHRVGIPGSGGPDWLRNDYEFIICATNGGKLPWSDNTAMGHAPKYGNGGVARYRKANGDRTHGDKYIKPKIANPGNVIHCEVGGGVMGSRLCHENEAPFPEDLVEFFVRSFCPPGGIVADPFAGSGTTLAVAKRCGRIGIGCDIRQSQVELTTRRLEEARGQ